MNNKGSLYLIPAPLGDCPLDSILPAEVLRTACALKIFVVEQTRTARRFLSAYGLKGHIEELEFHELNEHSSSADIEQLATLFDRDDVGLISEAGLPAVADPGADLVALCHRKGIRVVPMVGPSSLMLALMASGLNGQSFAFRGYIPAKSDERPAALKELEKISAKFSQSQLIIETPYRNDALFGDMLKYLSDKTRICIAANLTLPDQLILTRRVGEWKKNPISIGKRPCVFIVLA